MNIIQHKQQTLFNNCVSASIAMILNETVEDITKDFHSRYIDDWMEASDYFKEVGVCFQPCRVGMRHPEVNKIYIAVVASLNVRGGTHSIVIETVEEGWWVYDPNKGREGVHYYVAGNAEGELECNLTSYVLEYEFDRDYIRDTFYEELV